MNFIQLAGHLGADVETRFTPDGQKVSTLRVATKVRIKGKEETTWWRVTLWGDRFDKMLTYLKKGSAIIVVGEFVRAEVYTDRDGRQQVSLEVRAEFLRFSPFGRTDRPEDQAGSSATSHTASHDSYQQGSEYGQASYAPKAQPAATNRAPASHMTDISDEDVPF